jgi:hypothetical protein
LICPAKQHGRGRLIRWKNGGLFRALTALSRCVFLILLWAAIFSTGVVSVHAQSDGGGVINREYAIKAAYLYQFGYYIQWPAGSFADKQSPFVIGVMGEDPFGGALDEIAREKKIDGRPIVIKRFASPAAYSPCHILFVAASYDAANILPTIRKTQKFPVLLVGEKTGFALQGGTINLYIEQNKVRFEVNMEVAKQEQLKISSKLLSLAKIVGAP